MLLIKNNIINCCCFLAMIFCLASCDKVPVQFGSEGATGDPNITVIDTFTLSVSTLQLDSFSTKNTGYFIAGSHHDPALGYIESKAFFEIAPPVLDLRNTSNCRFDSIALYIQLSSGYMGDTTAPFKLNVNEVTAAMNDNIVPLGYNVSTLSYNTTPLASSTFQIRPSSKNIIEVRLPDAFGQTLFRMFQNNSDTITNIDNFKRFFKGICLTSDPANKALYYFDKSVAATSVIKLHYTIAGATPQSATANFSVNDGCYNFNSFIYDKTGTPLAVFPPATSELINSTATNNIGYLHYNSGLFPKISLGNLFSIKELHPYIQVLKAELDIIPVRQSFGQNTAYTLPPQLELRVADDNNYTNGSTLFYTGTTEPQYGNLFIDNLYGENTAYTYDVTNFVNTILAEGEFSQRALILYPLITNAASTDQRLLITNSASGKPNGSIKLKLSILGL